ncbi:unnamed protein product [Arctogadus glacialis]
MIHRDGVHHIICHQWHMRTRKCSKPVLYVADPCAGNKTAAPNAERPSPCLKETKHNAGYNSSEDEDDGEEV